MLPRKTARTPLFSALQQNINAARRLNLEATSHSKRLYSRRDALKLLALSSAALTASSALPGCRSGFTPQRTSPRIAVIGAGLGGLTAAYHLKKAGVKTQIFEASQRAGGRCHSANDFLAPGLATELGGEFLDSTHVDMLSLAKELQLEVYDVRTPAEERFVETYCFSGEIYTNRQVVEEFRPLALRLARDVEVFSTWETEPSPAVRALDHISLSEYLHKIGARGWIKDLLSVGYKTEYGIEPDEQSALNLISLIATDLSDNYFDMYGVSDERFKVRGGNQRIPDKLAHELADQIEYDHFLESVSETHNGYRLTFQNGASVKEYDADIIVLAIPFSILRNVTLPANFPPEKLRAIRELGYGSNCKVFMGFNSRPWRTGGYSGSFFTDKKFQSGWDNSRGQSGEAGGMTIFLGGKAGLENISVTTEAYTQEVLPWLDGPFDRMSTSFNGKVGRFHWASSPFSRGSYSVYKVGQWTSMSGIEGRPVGNIFFAGEHCSENFQGFMNGAAESGRLVAQEILTTHLGAIPADTSYPQIST